MERGTESTKQTRFSWPFYTGALLYLIVFFPQLGAVPKIDEPIFLYEGRRMAQGQWPYQQFFEFIPPGTSAVVALFIKLMGGLSILVMHGISLLLLMLCAFLVYRLARPYLSRPWWTAFFAFYAMLAVPENLIQVNHHLFSITLCLLVTLILAKEPQNPRRLITAGLLCGLILLFNQVIGALSLAGFTAWLVYAGFRNMPATPLGDEPSGGSNSQSGEGPSNKGLRPAVLKAALRFMLPGLLPSAGLLLLYGLHGGANDLLNDTVYWLFKGRYQQTTSLLYLYDGITSAREVLTHPASGILRLIQVLSLNRLLFLLVLPLLGLLGGAFLLWRSRGNVDRRLSLLYVAGLIMMVSGLYNPYTYVISVHSWLAVFFGLFFLQALLEKARPGLMKGVTTALLTLMLISGLGVSGIVAFAMWQQPRIISYGTLEPRLFAAMGTQPDQWNLLINFVHESSPEGRSLFVFNYSPWLYLLADRDNPTPYQILIARYNTPTQVEGTARILEKTRPAVIVYDHQDQARFQGQDLRFSAFRHDDYRLHPLERLILSKYQHAGDIGPYMVFSLRP